MVSLTYWKESTMDVMMPVTRTTTQRAQRRPVQEVKSTCSNTHRETSLQLDSMVWLKKNCRSCKNIDFISKMSRKYYACISTVYMNPSKNGSIKKQGTLKKTGFVSSKHETFSSKPWMFQKRQTIIVIKYNGVILHGQQSGIHRRPVDQSRGCCCHRRSYLGLKTEDCDDYTHYCCDPQGQEHCFGVKITVNNARRKKTWELNVLMFKTNHMQYVKLMKLLSNLDIVPVM